MGESIKIIDLKIPENKRIICISDIHGYFDLFLSLLDKINFSGDDILIILGDFYTKGPKVYETFKYIFDLFKSQNNNVYVIRGNCDWIIENMNESEKVWLENLPNIINTDNYVFVHGGLSSCDLSDLAKQDIWDCMKNDAFMEKDLVFDKYIITGHWPTNNYCHRIPCYNPIINMEKKIISIDGGTINNVGQLNAFIIYNSEFSFEYVDSLPVLRAGKNQTESGGTLNITWNDRFIELIEKDGEFSLCRHIKTGKTLCIPNISLWTDENGNLCAVNLATDYFLPVNTGDIISVEKIFDDKIFAKKDGVAGWINKEGLINGIYTGKM